MQTSGAFVLAAMVLSINLIHSRVGMALRAIHQNEQAAANLADRLAVDPDGGSAYPLQKNLQKPAPGHLRIGNR